MLLNYNSIYSNPGDIIHRPIDAIQDIEYVHTHANIASHSNLHQHQVTGQEFISADVWIQVDHWRIL